MDSVTEKSCAVVFLHDTYPNILFDATTPTPARLSWPTPY